MGILKMIFNFFGKSIKHLLLGCVYRCKHTLRLLVYSFFLFVVSVQANGKVIIDMYKTDQITVKEVNQKFGKKIEEIVWLMSPKRSVPDSEFERSGKLWVGVIDGIRSMGDFAYVNMSPVFYTGNEEDHVTLDIVDKKDQHRLAYFLPKPNGSFPDPDRLIEKWTQYESQGIKLLFQKQEIAQNAPIKCFVNHCVYGFEHKDLKPYESVFNRLVPKNKKKLIAILKKDRDEKKRASACFLLAHLKNPREVINTVSPSIFDSSAGVRNAAMRVIGGTLSRNPKIDFSIKTALVALDFPSETDRNKALYMISILSKKSKYHNYLRKHASIVLIEQLKMKQPNLHELSYQVLKKISGKNFGARDYEAWRQWEKSGQKKLGKLP